MFNGKKSMDGIFILITFLRSNKASLCVILVITETVLEINCPHLDMPTVDVLTINY